MARKVVILGFPGVQALDLVGPFDVFTGASVLVNGAYEVALASVDGQPVATGTGLEFVATKLPDPREPIDTLLLPGMAIVLTVLAFSLLGDALRDALDPHAWR